jgi:hypothetical protein
MAGSVNRMCREKPDGQKRPWHEASTECVEKNQMVKSSLVVKSGRCQLNGVPTECVEKNQMVKSGLGTKRQPNVLRKTRWSKAALWSKAAGVN